jgi:predicted signal transduction protein with EAL and GGDEF domain
VVAEGVETQAQARFMRACECNEAQGYLFGRPVSAGELSERLSGDLAGPSQRTEGSSPPARGSTGVARGS